MPSSSAPVDPEKLGHPVALTRGAEEGHASESANGSTVETPRGVSFASEETPTSEDSTQETKSSTIGGSTSAFDFAPGASFANTEESLASENIAQEKTTSTTGGLTSVSDFAQGSSSSTQESHTSEQPTKETTTSTGGGLFSVPDFTQPAEAKEEEVFSPRETSPGPATDSAQNPTA